MKKTEFKKTVQNLIREYYPKSTDPLDEYDAQVPDDSEASYLRGNEMSEEGLPVPERDDNSECCGAPMQWGGATPYCTKCGKETEPAIKGSSLYPYENMHEIYDTFKNVLKEGVSKTDFSQKIRGVFYEYAQGVENTVPITADPTRDPEAVEKEGEKVKEIGQAITDLGKKAKDIKNRPTTSSITKPLTVAEYVEKEMQPAILEIIKKAENPKATKKDLLEFFKLSSK